MKDQHFSLVSGALLAHACRLPPGADLVECLRRAARTIGESAVTVVTCVGSLQDVTLRMANAQAGDGTSAHRTWKESVEIVSLVGTLAVARIDGVQALDGEGQRSQDEVKFHLHISISDAKGHVYGGHLVSGIVHTTVELVLGSLQGVRFDRVDDANTGFRELVVTSDE